MKLSQVLIFLKEFIETNKIESLRTEFENLNVIASLYYEGHVLKCDWNRLEAAWEVEYSSSNDYVTLKETFKSYTETYIHSYLKHIDNELIKFHLNLKKLEFQELLEKLEKEIIELSQLAVKKSNDHLADLITNFLAKTFDKYFGNNVLNAVSTEYSPKIKWLGAINTLTTFLLDYSSSKNNLNKPIINHDIPAFKALILNCFIDERGNPFPKTTIDTYFDTNKQPFKRAKKDLVKLQSEDILYAEEALEARPTVKKTAIPFAHPLPKGIDKPSTKTS